MPYINIYYLLDLLEKIINNIDRDHDRISDLRQSKDLGQRFIQKGIKQSIDSIGYALKNIASTYINEINDNDGIFIYFVDGIKNYYSGYSNFAINIVIKQNQEIHNSIMIFPVLNKIFYTKYNAPGLYLKQSTIEKRLRVSQQKINLSPIVANELTIIAYEYLNKNNQLHNCHVYGCNSYVLSTLLEAKSNVIILNKPNEILKLCINDIITQVGGSIILSEDDTIIATNGIVSFINIKNKPSLN